ncbi:MAG: PKD domain-containing protein [Nitrospirae bacterium]|nr:PKD domain-containing protein [Nitrospirota bacterium]
MTNKFFVVFIALSVIVFAVCAWIEPVWSADSQSAAHDDYKKRIAEKHKKEGEGKDKAIEEVIKILKDLGKGDEEGWIREWYKNGKEWQAKGTGNPDNTPKIIFGDGGNGYEPDNNAIEINVGRANVYKGEELDYGALLDLATSILHEHAHSQEWFSSMGTTTSGEKTAYTGIHSMLADWMQHLQKELLSKSQEPICDQAIIAKKILGVIGSLGTNESSLNEMSPERRSQLQKEAESLYLKRDKAKKELHWHDPHSTKYVELETEIQQCENKLKYYEKRFKEDFVFDAGSFVWTDEKGKQLTRKDISELAQNIKKKADEIVSQCEEEKNRPKGAKDPSDKDRSAVNKSKDELNGCLCRCTINPTVGVGATYDPKAWKNASPSCDDARYGPCVGFGLGCWREHMRNDGECFEQCVAAAGAKPQEVKAEIYQTRFKAYNDFLGEARGIIEEYLTYKARFSQTTPHPAIKEDFVQLAGNFPDDASLGQILFAAAAPASAPSSYAEKVRQKNRRGDPDRALGLVRAAESVMPDRKASGETTNILAEFAIIMSKASLNIVTEFEFDEGLYLLSKAAEFYSVGKSNPLGEEIQRLIRAFEKWKEDWQTLKSQIPVCQSLIKDKRVCECDRLNSEKITPAANSLTIYESASSEKWSISTATGAPRPLPEKDRMYKEFKDSLSRAKNECANNPVMNTKEMKALTDYETGKFLQKSPYINQEELKKNSAPVICDTRAVKTAEKLLSSPGLCDCQQEKIKGILDAAKKDERPLEIEFNADKRELSVGERVLLNLSIKGGVPPFSADMIGDYIYTQQSEARGFSINYQTEKAGTNTFFVTVVDSCGESDSRKVYVAVKPGRDVTSDKTPKVEQKLTVALRADKTRLKVNEQTFVHISVQNHKPPYTVRWGGHAQGLGDHGGKVPFVGAASPGTYAITAEVTDAAGRSAAGSITLTVIGEKASKSPVRTSGSDVSKSPTTPVYDPTKDPNIGSTNTKNINIAQVDQLGNDFRDGPKGPKQSDTKTDSRQSPVVQPDTYRNNKKEPDPGGDPNSNTQPFYPPVSSSNPRTNWTDWTKSRGDRGDSSSRWDNSNNSSAPKANCDPSRKQAAYQDGVTCGQKAKQNNGTMSSECKTASQGYMNTDTQMGWGSCLYSGFDEGYRAGLGTTAGGGGDVMAELENRAGENVHIFAEGQDNFGPQNKLAPGEKKKVGIKVPKGGGSVKFIAGRNGQKLAECKWDYTPDSWSRVPVVKFSAPKSLTCTVGLR